MKCDEMDQIMMRILAGEATTEDHHLFDEHLPSCSRCQTDWLAFQHVEATFRALADQPEKILPNVEVPKGMVESALASYDRIQAQEAKKSNPKRRKWLYPVTSGLVAASVFGLFWMQMDQGQLTEPLQVLEKAQSEAIPSAMTNSETKPSEQTIGVSETKEVATPTNENTQTTQDSSEQLPAENEKTKPIEVKENQNKTNTPSLKSSFIDSSSSAEDAIQEITEEIDSQDPTYQVMNKQEPVVFWVDQLKREKLSMVMDVEASMDVAAQEMSEVSDVSVKVMTKPSSAKKPTISNSEKSNARSELSFAANQYRLVLENGKLFVESQSGKRISESSVAFRTKSVLQSVKWSAETSTLDYVISDATEKISGSLLLSYEEQSN